MEVRKRFLVILFVSFSGISQVVPDIRTDIIEFSYDSKGYSKIAYDTIKQIYNNQHQYFLKNHDRANRINAISEIYKLEDLSFYSIPKFRLVKDAGKKYNCKSNIENFIEFEETYKYQDVLIYSKNEVICKVDIPNFYYELGRINNPSLTSYYGKEEYISEVLEMFLSFPLAYSHTLIEKMLSERPQNFFFTIFGIQSVIFEIDKHTGLLFANWIGTGSNRDKRMLANDYIRKFIGKKNIQKFASGEYDSGDYSAPCKTIKKQNKIIIKVTAIN